MAPFHQHLKMICVSFPPNNKCIPVSPLACGSFMLEVVMAHCQCALRELSSVHCTHNWWASMMIIRFLYMEINPRTHYKIWKHIGKSHNTENEELSWAFNVNGHWALFIKNSSIKWYTHTTFLCCRILLGLFPSIKAIFTLLKKEKDSEIIISFFFCLCNWIILGDLFYDSFKWTYFNWLCSIPRSAVQGSFLEPILETDFQNWLHTIIYANMYLIWVK